MHKKKRKRQVTNSYTENLEKLSEWHKGSFGIPINSEELKDFKPIPGQCMYRVNFKDKNLYDISGVTEMLGYSVDEFNLELVTTYFHPEEKFIIETILSAVYEVILNNNFDLSVPFHISHHVRKKNGEFIKILRHSFAIEKDETGRFMGNISILTDISYIDKTNRVSWYTRQGSILDQLIQEKISEIKAQFFTKRELEIILKLSQSHTSNKIGEDLGITKNTVDTIRRNMLRKTNTKSTTELINFYKKFFHN